MAPTTFHIRPASESRDDAAFIVRAHDSALPYLASLGSSQWGTQLFSARSSAVEAIEKLVRESEQYMESEEQADGSERDAGSPFVRTWIVEVLPNAVPCAAASVSDAFPSYIKAPPSVGGPDTFLYLNRLITDRNVQGGKGAGAALLQHCKDKCSELGKRTLFTDCFAGPPYGLRSYYEKNGFRFINIFSVPSKHVDGSDWQDSFTYDTGDHGWGNQELQCYTTSARNAYVDAQGDSLVISAIADPDGRMTSARLVSKQCLELPRGYVEAHILAPQATGIWYAFWLLPKAPFSWPSDGEVDIAEGWDAKQENGACLHWGHFNGQDYDKHRVRHHAIDGNVGHTYGFCWSDEGLLWFCDGQPTMRATVPAGLRPFRDFQVLLNIAMGGNVMGGSTPQVPSTNNMVVRNLHVCRAPPMGWGCFKDAWASAPEGNTM